MDGFIELENLSKLQNLRVLYRTIYAEFYFYSLRNIQTTNYD